MAVPSSANPASHWNSLHSDPRFRPLYPNDHVVRFVRAHAPAPGTRKSALDIGFGGGRHLVLLAENGFDVHGVDFSSVACEHARARLERMGKRADLRVSDMSELPFEADAFDLALSFGVLYYGDAAAMHKAIAELHRVLRPGGAAFLVLRTTGDYRFGKGVEMEHNTFRLTLADTNEQGLVNHFLEESDVPTYFRDFGELSFEKTETTRQNRTIVDSDWLITLRK